MKFLHKHFHVEKSTGVKKSSCARMSKNKGIKKLLKKIIIKYKKDHQSIPAILNLREEKII